MKNITNSKMNLFFSSSSSSSRAQLNQVFLDFRVSVQRAALNDCLL